MDTEKTEDIQNTLTNMDYTETVRKSNSSLSILKVSAFCFIILGVARIYPSATLTYQFFEKALVFSKYDSISDRLLVPIVLSYFDGSILIILGIGTFYLAFKRLFYQMKLFRKILWLVLSFSVILFSLSITINASTINDLMQIDIPVHKYAQDTQIQKYIDRFQVGLKCCGNNSYWDYEGIQYLANQSTAAVYDEGDDQNAVLVTVPTSCCFNQSKNCLVRVRGCQQALTVELMNRFNSFAYMGLVVIIFLGFGLKASKDLIRFSKTFD